MFKYTALCVALFAPLSACAASDDDLRAMREEIQQLKDDYGQRIQQLEQRLQQAETASRNARDTATQAEAAAQQANHPAASAAGAFNPALSLILSGTYGQIQQADAPATGFEMLAHTPPDQGFSLGESEIGMTANIDPQFRAVGTFSLDSDGGISVENAFVQTTTLGNGFNFKFGRYFSGLGYLNEQHSHTWDFVDQPLVYQVFWDNQMGEDGVQFKWLAPTDTFIEIGAELGRGRGYPGSDRQKNGSGSGVLFAHVGDDVGISNSWRAGISLHETKRENAQSDAVPDVPGTIGGVSNLFTGDSKTAGLDFVWKYAPDGNVIDTNFKLQGEYFRRKEDGMLTYDITGANITDGYSVTRSGWYLQGVYQFMPRWRVGLRYDQLDPGTAQVGALNAGNVISSFGYNPSRNSLMVDYNPSEFSRLRLQLAQDKSRQGLTDNQLYLQYVMSLGAHGAHQF